MQMEASSYTGPL